VFGRFYRASQMLRRFRVGSAALLFRERRRALRPEVSRRRTLRRRDEALPPVHFRPGTTDARVISQVLVDDEYAPVMDLADVRVIVDAGANIGATSMQLLEVYPKATVIAIEPDGATFEVLETNLKPYGARAVALRAALWGEKRSLAIARGHFRDGGAWSFEAMVGDGTNEEVESVTVDELVTRFNLTAIDLLKVDIERGERSVFGGSAGQWLDRVRVIAIELHDAECRAAFEGAIAAVPGAVAEYPHLTVWRARRT
jgi:FkbM family methyltransferase